VFAPLLLALATALPGAEGSSRPPRDEAWLSHPLVVGGTEGSGGRHVAAVLSGLGVYMVSLMSYVAKCLSVGLQL
jgi:hypothetical protein